MKNFETDRWPAGNPETGYMNVDGGPTKTEILKARRNPKTAHYWQLAFGKRDTEELYDIKKDPAEKNNVAEKNPKIVTKMSQQLEKIVDGRYGLPL